MLKLISVGHVFSSMTRSMRVCVVFKKYASHLPILIEGNRGM